MPWDREGVLNVHVVKIYEKSQLGPGRVKTKLPSTSSEEKAQACSVWLTPPAGMAGQHLSVLQNTYQPDEKVQWQMP